MGAVGPAPRRWAPTGAARVVSFETAFSSAYPGSLSKVLLKCVGLVVGCLGPRLRAVVFVAVQHGGWQRPPYLYGAL